MKALALLILAVATVAAAFYFLSRDADGQTPAFPECPSLMSGVLGRPTAISSQAWWTNPAGNAGATDFGHMHEEACIPERGIIVGPTKLRIKIVMHENPSRTLPISIVTKGLNYETTVLKIDAAKGLTCPVGTCERWVEFTLTPQMFQKNGLQEVRYRLFADTPDGNRMHASLNYQVYVCNRSTGGCPLSTWEYVTRMPYLRFKGWYGEGSFGHVGYCEPDYLSVPVNVSSVRGIWRPAVKMVNHDASLPISRHMVTLDPDFHMHNHGTVLLEGDGQLPSTQLAIDTTQLPNGIHKLALKADCDDPSGSVNSGIGIVFFKVAN